MSKRFSSFVLLAEMRTGSNFLEANLNAIDGLTCFGEAFNPAFIGYPNRDDILGITQAVRDLEPLTLLHAIRQGSEALGGFRYFHDHDPRVLAPVLDDQTCAKVILTRNPLDSYVSWKIAKATGQWKLGNVKQRKEAQADFDAEEFAGHVKELQAFQLKVLKHLQSTGQTAFFISYDDLQDLDVINGLAEWLGVDGRLDALDDSLKPQNPKPVLSKVSNPDEMTQALSGLDWFNLGRTPNFEPRRGPAVPTYFAAEKAPLLFMPIAGSSVAVVEQWIAQIDGVQPQKLISGLNQKHLRQWKSAHPGFRSFTVLRHPLARAHAAFCETLLYGAPQATKQIRRALKHQFGVKLPEGEALTGYGLEQHKATFAGFLEFVQANLNGQTTVRVDASWASQAQIIAGFSEVAAPDLILREDELSVDLPHLALKVAPGSQAEFNKSDSESDATLAAIYSPELEQTCRRVYKRDYRQFGFADWTPKR